MEEADVAVADAGEGGYDGIYCMAEEGERALLETGGEMEGGGCLLGASELAEHCNESVAEAHCSCARDGVACVEVAGAGRGLGGGDAEVDAGKSEEHCAWGWSEVEDEDAVLESALGVGIDAEVDVGSSSDDDVGAAEGVFEGVGVGSGTLYGRAESSECGAEAVYVVVE